ncbi:diguanylate cyclase [Collinsella sp. An271]|uniref:nitroreductase n=1 Tax=Collinsella sp. An271 TaxID=1965616 RepID=UPI000B38C76F|nr:nitroreductase [Collinsella sp. An271]OUO61748.1 diguanylate cyclase [Collinsella sp. An271]
MNTLDALTTRRSVRSYRSDPVPKDALDRIIEAGTYAPTGMGRQSPIIIAITDQKVRNELSALNAKIMGSDGDPFYGAPAVLVVLARKDVPTHVYDGSLVMGNLMNAAHELGIASCWIHRAKEEFELPEGRALLQGLGIDADAYEGIGHCILGYADGAEPELKPRKEDYVYRIA